MEYLNDRGARVPVEIQRRKGTRRLKLTLGLSNQIRASAPWHMRDREVFNFIETQRPWLDRQLAQAPPIVSLGGWLEQTPQLSASGDRFAARKELGRPERGRSLYRFDDAGSVVVLRLRDDTEGSLRRVVHAFAQDALTCRLAYYAKRFGLTYAAFSVRDQSSRWGSCSARRGISLNWRLVLLAPELQDYVILHELAHLVELNHSPRFWALLETYDPLRCQHESDLDACGARIMRVGRGDLPPPD